MNQTKNSRSFTSGQVSFSPFSTSSMRPSISIIRLRMSSSLAASEAKQRNAPCRDSGDGHRIRFASEQIRWLLMAASRCSSESIFKQSQV